MDLYTEDERSTSLCLVGVGSPFSWLPYSTNGNSLIILNHTCKTSRRQKMTTDGDKTVQENPRTLELRGLFVPNIK